MVALISLTVVAGPLSGMRFDVPEAGATLGRSRLAEIHLDDGLLSRMHCAFAYGADGVATVQDLGSSNGTLLNGAPLGAAPAALREGDVLSVGEVVLRVSRTAPEAQSPAPPIPAPLPDPPVASVPPVPEVVPVQDASPAGLDLGLGGAEGEADAPEPKVRRNPLVALIAALAALVLVTLGAGIFFAMGRKSEPAPGAGRAHAALADAASLPLELRYERLAVDEGKLFRYRLEFGDDKVLRLATDDLGEEDRSFAKEKALGPKGEAELRRAVLASDYMRIGTIYPERSASPAELKRRSLTIVLGAEVWQRTAENTSERSFDALCARLETFARNELNLHAEQYSVAELRAMGEDELARGRRYWEQRDLGDEKLWECIVAYRRGVSYLETLNPKPSFAGELEQGLREAESLLDERHQDALFAVDQALNTQRYDVAAEQLRKILRMVPDREEPRNAAAMEKLLAVENRFLKRRN